MQTAKHHNGRSATAAISKPYIKVPNTWQLYTWLMLNEMKWNESVVIKSAFKNQLGAKLRLGKV